MGLKVSKVEVWAATIEDRTGGLVHKLAPLSAAGANLEFVIARRVREQPGKAVVFVAPLSGEEQVKGATDAGFRRMACTRFASRDPTGGGHDVGQGTGRCGNQPEGTFRRRHRQEVRLLSGAGHARGCREGGSHREEFVLTRRSAKPLVQTRHANPSVRPLRPVDRGKRGGAPLDSGAHKQQLSRQKVYPVQPHRSRLLCDAIAAGSTRGLSTVRLRKGGSTCANDC